MTSLYYGQGKHYLSINDFIEIEENLKKFPLEEVTIGDAGEPNKCLVGRLVEDQPGTKPKIIAINGTNGNQISNRILRFMPVKKIKSS